MTSSLSFCQAFWHRLLFGLIVPLVVLFAVPAQAEPVPGDACSPSGIFTRSGGPEVPGGGHYLVCDGSEWQSVLDYDATSGRVDVDIGNDTGSCTAAKTGRLRYDDAADEWEYCSGSDPWLSLKPAGLSGPAGCENIGDLCADGTVFAGFHPVLHEHLFIPPTDQGTDIQWKTSTGANDIATDSLTDGRINTNQVANSATFPAFKVCKDLGTGGHSDWYLPSRLELYYLWAVHHTIVAGGHITDYIHNFLTGYWTSTEGTNSYGTYQLFLNGDQMNTSKSGNKHVRCVRR